jgi:hypothetical protein
LHIHIGLKHREHNPGIEWYGKVCPYCSVRFPSEKALEKHMPLCPHRPAKAAKRVAAPPRVRFREVGRAGMRVVKKIKLYDITTQPSGEVLAEGKHVRIVRWGQGIKIEPVKASVVMIVGRMVAVSKKTGVPRKEWVRETKTEPRFRPVTVAAAHLNRAEKMIAEAKLPKYAKDEALELLPTVLRKLKLK